MASVDDAYGQLWRAINPNVALNVNAGLYKAWQSQHAEWGSPIQDEFTTAAGIPTQVFSNAIVEWHSDGPHVLGT